MYRTGDKWDAMTITAIEWDEQGVTELDADGREYVADTVSMKVVKLQCDCGSGIISVPYNKFRKREYPDCGCGLSWSGDKVVTSVQLPIALNEHIKQYAAHKGMSRNQVIVSALVQFFSANQKASK